MRILITSLIFILTACSNPVEVVEQEEESSIIGSWQHEEVYNHLFKVREVYAFSVRTESSVSDGTYTRTITITEPIHPLYTAGDVYLYAYGVWLWDDVSPHTLIWIPEYQRAFAIVDRKSPSDQGGRLETREAKLLSPRISYARVIVADGEPNYLIFAEHTYERIMD